MRTARISISVVSHAQITLITSLLHDLDEYCREIEIELILTLNLDEKVPFTNNEFSFPILIVRNPKPIGFAANHNNAFTYATGQYFCVMNPDIRLHNNPFSALVEILQDSIVGVVAPLVLDRDGKIEDSARQFPSPLKIICKVFGRCKGGDYLYGNGPVMPDWVGGMFLLFTQKVFNRLGGFDQRYFLYYEDVDLCLRLRLLGYEVVLYPLVMVTHNAQRSSHRHFKYLFWHLCSMMRFFLSLGYLRVQSLKFKQYMRMK